MKPSQMTSAEIRAIVDAVGWVGLRIEHPIVWSEIARQLKQADRYIDACEIEECRRVGC